MALKLGSYLIVKTSAVCGPYLQTSAVEEVDYNVTPHGEEMDDESEEDDDEDVISKSFLRNEDTENI
ncbi:hypothetical protein LXL04_014366 [Taraxacum kok-saghyz]